MRVLITGASGLLGREVHKQVSGCGWDVRGLSSSRHDSKLVECNLTEEGAIERQMSEFAPHVVIHMAGERRPDAVHKNPDQARTLNVDATAKLAKSCREHGAWLLYLSTDYVFDGKSPPYAVDAVANPLSTYGAQKLEAEHITLQECPTAAVLRVPLLFGRIEYLRESSVTALYGDLKKGITKADHIQRRYPTCTDDVARIVKKMLDTHCEGRSLHGIFHWQADECLTKYDMVQVIADLFEFDGSTVSADVSAPRFPRPEDSKLDCSRLVDELQIHPEHFRTPFRHALLRSICHFQAKLIPQCQSRDVACGNYKSEA